MKICFVSPFFDPLIIGGAETFASSLVEQLCKHHKVLVITNAAKGINFKNKTNLKIVTVHPTNIYSLYDYSIRDSNLTSRIVWQLFNIWNVSAYFQIISILKKENPDIVHSNGVKGFSSSFFSAVKKTKIPHVHSLNGFELLSPWETLYRNNKMLKSFNIFDKIYLSHYRRISNNVNAVISPSNFLLDFHKKHGFFQNSEMFLVPHGSRFGPVPNSKSYFTKEFLYLGQTIESKGIQYVIKAIKNIQNQDFKFHIVGKGSYLSTLKELAQGDKRIEFYGFLKENDLQTLMNKCSFGIIPSVWNEAFGLVIIELMSKSIPVLGSKIGAIPEIIKDGYNGFLFESGNVLSIQKLLERVIDTHENFSTMSKNALETSKEYSIEKMTKNILNIYSSVINKTNKKIVSL